MRNWSNGLDSEKQSSDSEIPCPLIDIRDLLRLTAIDLQFPRSLKCYDMIFRSSASLATGRAF